MENLATRSLISCRDNVCLLLVLLFAVPSCQPNFYFPDLSQGFGYAWRGKTSVQEGSVTVRDGEEVQVCYKTIYHAPPRLVIVEINQSAFKDVPFKLDDFEIREQGAACFKILNKHGERHYGAWAVLKWRAEGIRAGEAPEGAKTRQEQIIAMVNKAGGKITLDPKLPNSPIAAIDLHRCRITDADLALLKDLTSLHVLNLYGTSITDAGLVNLAGLSGLHTLYLNDTAITDAGLQQLQRLTALHELGLYHTHVTDNGLAYLAGLNNLQSLSLSGQQITDQGLANLKRLPNLRRVYLSRTHVTDAAVHDFEQGPPRRIVTR